MTYHFELALLSDGWARDVCIDVDEATGTIKQIAKAANAAGSFRKFAGAAIPGFINAHSHAFQRAFTGLSEFRTQRGDSFWTWRKLMYEFLETLSPDDVYRIARRLYGDMLLAGYTSVCEFHYVHNAADGGPYSNLAEMANAVIQAAVDSGIAICMLPVLYQRGGFDNRKLEGGQKRFGLSDEQFMQMVQSLEQQWRGQNNVNLGMAFHSLRAVGIGTIQRIAKQFSKLLPDAPIHIHVAEQTKEVDDCLEAHQRRPVEFLFDNLDIDSRWCLIHATHLTAEENKTIAKSGATVCVCPNTEANLGDGIFAAEEYLMENSGSLAIGTDSNIALNPFSELRMLEYGQRLSKRRRAILCTDEISTGRFLCSKAWQSGKKVTGQSVGSIEVGMRADLAILDISEDFRTSLFKEPDRILDFAVFNETIHMVLASMSAGKVYSNVERE